MSFSENVKNEILSCVPSSACCGRVFLYVMLKAAGSIESDLAGSMTIRIRAFSMALVRAIGSLLKKITGEPISSIYETTDNLTKKKYFQCQIEGRKSCEKILKALELGHALFTEAPPPDNLLAALGRPCCQEAFLKAVAVACGYFQNPNRSYHFEIRLSEPFLANIVKKLFRSRAHCNLKTHILRCDGVILLYSKSFENLERILAFLKTTSCYLELENIKIIREIKNDTNRNVNFEMANIKRTADISAEHIKKIKALLKSPFAEKLTPPLLEIAKLRTSHPGLSLAELAAQTRPKVSKSAVNGRLRRLMELYAEYESKTAAAEGASSLLTTYIK